MIPGPADLCCLKKFWQILEMNFKKGWGLKLQTKAGWLLNFLARQDALWCHLFDFPKQRDHRLMVSDLREKIEPARRCFVKYLWRAQCLFFSDVK